MVIANRNNRLKLILVLLAMTPFLLLFIAIVAIVLLSFRVTAELDSLRESIRRDGYPLSPEELDAWYPAVPDETNVALALLEAFPLYVELRDIDPNMDVFDSEFDLTLSIPAEALELKRQLTETNKGYLAALHDAASLPGPSRFPIDLRIGILVETPHLSLLKNAVRMLSMEALVAAHDGRGEDAARSIVDALRVSNTLRDEPLLVSALVPIACTGVSVSHLEQVLNRVDLTSEQLAEIGQNLDPLLGEGSFIRAMIGERSASLIPTYTYESFSGNSTMQPGLGRVCEIVGYYDAERLHLLQAYTRIVELAELDPVARRKESLAFVHEIDSQPTFGNLWTKTMIPAIARAAEAFDRGEAMVTTALVAVAAQRYRLDQGAYPKSLDTLVPRYLEAVPVDPFDGQSIRFRSTSSEILVYSIAHNRIDDGGSPAEPRNKILEEGDLTFEMLW